MYWLWAVLLIVSLVAAWIATLFSLPGNWIMVVLVGVFAFFFPETDGHGVSWIIVAILAGLAGIGELVEFLASAAGVAKTRGGKKTMALAVGVSMIGSIIGAIVGVPIPIVGSLVGAILGGAVGAFGGAYLGETLAGKSAKDAATVSTAALVGRLLGTGAKAFLGIAMIVVAGVAVVA